MKHKIVFVDGDGVGPELAAVTRKCVEAAGLADGVEWDIRQAGEDVFKATGNPMPDEVIEAIRRCGVGIKAPVTTPVGEGFRSVNVLLRQKLDLYACLRPCKLYKGVRAPLPNVDLVIVRENTEDLYAGIEFRKGEKPTAELIDMISRLSGKHVPPDSGISIKPISVTNTRRIVKFAFEYAIANKRRKVTAVHKANIMKFTDGLFLEVSREVAREYEGRIEFEDRIVDNMCMQLVQKPELYDVLVLPNLYGDILSDLCAGLVGGLGVAPGGNIGDKCAVFEATHGSAPKYKGQNKVNPVGLLLSAVMMLHHLKETKAADRLENAIARVIAEGRDVTYDLKPHRDDPTAVGTREMGDAIIRAMR